MNMVPTVAITTASPAKNISNSSLAHLAQLPSLLFSANPDLHARHSAPVYPKLHGISSDWLCPKSTVLRTAKLITSHTNGSVQSLQHRTRSDVPTFVSEDGEKHVVPLQF